MEHCATRSSALGLAAVVLVTAACAPRKLDVQVTTYHVDVRVDPSESALAGSAEILLDVPPSAGERKRRAAIDLRLHPALAIEAIELDGATLRKTRLRPGRAAEGETKGSPFRASRHRLVLERPAAAIRIVLRYAGRLRQDVSAGERPGQIHNRAMRAHVGSEGVYLVPAGYWYPRVAIETDRDLDRALADYRLSLDPVDGFEWVAGVERVRGPGDGRLHWASPFPLDGLVLLGGPLERWSRRHGVVELHAVLAPGKKAVAVDVLDAAADYLDRYETLIGPYPYREFTVLEAFFSSGFAFPTCTQISGSQLSEYRQYRRHGYLDHELLHNWWGNGIFVDPDDGNWCEGLATYAGNYYGHVLDGSASEARKQRRNYSNFLSRIAPGEDLPLASFGLEGGAGRAIGYDKGAAVFHMLERKLGREAFFDGLKRLTLEHMGRHASWRDLQRAWEHASGRDLATFFDQWVRGRGAPSLRLVDARWSPGSSHVEVTISQQPSRFVLDVPLRLHYGARVVDVEVPIRDDVETVSVPCEPEGLAAVELDPDYHLFRRLAPEETMPTSALTRRAERLTVVVPDGEYADGYREAADLFRRGVAGGDGADSNRVRTRRASEVTAEDLQGTALLILDDAVHHPAVSELLSRTPAPVRWHGPAGSGFEVEGRAYDGAGHAVFFTVHHPDDVTAGVTVYYGNAEPALANARVLGFYPNSLLVFESPLEPVESASGMPPSKVLRRIDFEFHDRIELGGSGPRTQRVGPGIDAQR